MPLSLLPRYPSATVPFPSLPPPSFIEFRILPSAIVSYLSSPLFSSEMPPTREYIETKVSGKVPGPPNHSERLRYANRALKKSEGGSCRRTLMTLHHW